MNTTNLTKINMSLIKQIKTCSSQDEKNAIDSVLRRIRQWIKAAEGDAEALIFLSQSIFGGTEND